MVVRFGMEAAATQRGLDRHTLVPDGQRGRWPDGLHDGGWIVRHDDPPVRSVRRGNDSRTLALIVSQRLPVWTAHLSEPFGRDLSAQYAAIAVCHGGLLRNHIDDYEAHSLNKIADAATEDARLATDRPMRQCIHSE